MNIIGNNGEKDPSGKPPTKSVKFLNPDVMADNPPDKKSKKMLSKSELHIKSKMESIKSQQNFEVKSKSIIIDKIAQAKSTEKVPYKRLWDEMTGKKLECIFGIFCAFANGAYLPTLGYLLADMLFALSMFMIARDPSSGVTKDQARSEVDGTLYKFFIFGGCAFITYTGQLQGLTVAGEHITRKLRAKLYNKFINMDMEFFDKPENGVGELTSRLTKDCTTVNCLVTRSIGGTLQAISALLVGLGLAFSGSWAITLFAVGCAPMIVVSTYLRAKEMEKDMLVGKCDDGVNIIQESVTNIRATKSLNLEEISYKRFEDTTNPEKLGQTTCHDFMGSFWFGVGMWGQFQLYAFVFYMGAIWTRDYDLGFQPLFRSLFAILFCAFGAGFSQNGAGDVGEASRSAINIFKNLDLTKKIISKENPQNWDAMGRIEFINITFKYPTRKEYVFRNLNFVIESGSKVAFAGSSGSGKSTIIQLILRFYEPISGQILLDGVDIKDISLEQLRSNFGLVSQEPILFNQTIEYNIKYNQYKINESQIRQAAITSHAINFIEKDEKFAFEEQVDEQELGFKRTVGLKGGKLSGGQKQRVAIARAVVRQPEIYLFDEATSALDTESEKIVQDALDTVGVGRTSVNIAHRISTIKGCDKIFVIDKKRVKEQGTFDELMAMKGVFYKINAEG